MINKKIQKSKIQNQFHFYKYSRFKNSFKIFKVLLIMDFLNNYTSSPLRYLPVKPTNKNNCKFNN